MRGGDADVRGALALAVVDRAHAVPDLETDVPQEREEALDALMARPGAVSLFGSRIMHVDVGAGMQFAAPEATHGDQRDVLFARVLAAMQRPSLSCSNDVDHARAVADQGRSIGSSSSKPLL